MIVFARNLHKEQDIDIHPVTFTPASWTATAWRELQTLLGLVLIAALVYWAIRARKRNPSVFMALVIAGISYLPISGPFSPGTPRGAQSVVFGGAGRALL